MKTQVTVIPPVAPLWVHVLYPSCGDAFVAGLDIAYELLACAGPLIGWKVSTIIDDKEHQRAAYSEVTEIEPVMPCGNVLHLEAEHERDDKDGWLPSVFLSEDMILREDSQLHQVTDGAGNPLLIHPRTARQIANEWYEEAQA